MDNKSKIFIEKHLWELWLKLNLDKPSNWNVIVEFVINDVETASSYLNDGEFHSGDVEIAFRRFVESVYETA
mgnify:CR=1 FL=1